MAKNMFDAERLESILEGCDILRTPWNNVIQDTFIVVLNAWFDACQGLSRSWLE
jgi:hypothetical protein